VYQAGQEPTLCGKLVAGAAVVTLGTAATAAWAETVPEVWKSTAARLRMAANRRVAILALCGGEACLCLGRDVSMLMTSPVPRFELDSLPFLDCGLRGTWRSGET